MLTSKTPIRFFVGIFFGIMCTLGLEVCAAAQVSEAEVSVPKGIQDIVALIKNSTADSKARESDIKLLSEQPASNLSIQDKYAFYYLQSLAAERLGRIDLRIDLLKKALEFAKERTHQEFVVTGELAGAEMQIGRAHV